MCVRAQVAASTRAGRDEWAWWLALPVATTVATGLLGMMGNKGGAAIRFRLLDSTVCFVCSHLAAHRENVAGRNADFHKWVRACGMSDRICDNLRFKAEGEEGEGVGVMDHDLVFWVG